jgi:hypothetical protein
MVESVIFQADSPIARFIDKPLDEAVALHASDIHFEIFDGKFVICYMLPTQYGERVILHILNNYTDIFAPDPLMHDYDELSTFLKNIPYQSGLTLFVGLRGAANRLHSIAYCVKEKAMRTRRTTHRWNCSKQCQHYYRVLFFVGSTCFSAS